jgi:hypothetical protein
VKRFRNVGLLAIASLILASCGGHSSMPPAASGPGSAQQNGEFPLWSHLACYHTTGPAYTAQATVTFYGWPDNTPPGNAIAHPVIHKVASGDGTFCNPTTFATEPTKAENAKIPYGTRIYVPFIKQYFIREDDCTPSGPPVGHGNNGCYKLWFDLWIGGDKDSKTWAVVKCENDLTPGTKVPVIVNPPSGEPVSDPGPIFRDGPGNGGTCDGSVQT